MPHDVSRTWNLHAWVVLGVIERTFSMLASPTHDRILEKLLNVGHVQNQGLEASLNISNWAMSLDSGTCYHCLGFIILWELLVL